MREILAIVFAPIAGIFIFTLFERGPFLFQSFNSGSDATFVLDFFMIGVFQLLPAYVLLLLISLPIYFVARRIIGTTFIACLVIAGSTVCLLVLLFWAEAGEELLANYSSITILALLLSAFLYGSVMWLIAFRRTNDKSRNG